MKNRYKPHLIKIMRARTSVGRDLEHGVRLDRNERVTNFSDSIIRDLYAYIPTYAFNVYPDLDRLYGKLSKWTGLSVEELYVTNGITEGIRIIFETLVNPGDKVLAISPSFPMYHIYGQIYQAEWCAVELSKDLTIDIGELIGSIDKRTALVCLPNPNLPIENLFSVQQIRSLADKCKECGAILVVDEAYYYFGSTSAISLVAEYDNLVVFQTFSKALGLAGVRLGYIVSNKDNIEYLSKTRSLVEINGISAAIGEYILDHPEIMNEYVRDVKIGREYIQQELRNMGIKYSGGQITNGMLIFLNTKAETEALLEVLKKSRIYVRGSFGPPIDNCIRLTLGPQEAMERFIAVFKKWLSDKES
ncbi:MAG: histidinol-phosphate aminotransferase family protein [Candidatus Omnitrophica bacterium]|nr:histidinol-phosphate aminotransferase family protein [Candidatus Omnitrophota bacterium]